MPLLGRRKRGWRLILDRGTRGVRGALFWRRVWLVTLIVGHGFDAADTLSRFGRTNNFTFSPIINPVSAGMPTDARNGRTAP
jgi:hypothetical protein